MARDRTGTVRWYKGSWRIQVSLGRDPSGKWRYKTESVKAPNTKAGEAVARKVLAKLLLEVQADLHPAVEKGTFEEVMNRWIDSREGEWSDGAAKHVRQVLGNHVIPDFGSSAIERIRAADVDALYAKLRRKGLSAATIKRIHNNVHAVFAQAVRYDMIAKNPAAVATVPTVPKARRRGLPDPAAVRNAISDAPPWLAMIIALAVHTGMRRGELVQLRWADIDFDECVMRVMQTKTKTEKTIKLGPATTAHLRRWRTAVSEKSLAVGEGEPEWVFPAHVRSAKLRGTGAHVRADAVTAAWSEQRDKHGLDAVRFHDLRHTMATRLLKRRHDVGTVAERGGWANAAVLLTTYDHPVTEADEAAAVDMEAWLYGTG